MGRTLSVCVQPETEPSPTKNGRCYTDKKWTLLDPLETECCVSCDGETANMTVGSLKVEVRKGWQRCEFRFLRDGKVLENQQTVLCHAALNEFIAFVREGAEVLSVF